MNQETQVAKRGRGRPRKDVTPEVAAQTEVPSAQRQRPRTRVGGFRDKLTVRGIDPNFKYRWVLDIDATGSQILSRQQQGYELVRVEEGLEIGEAYVFSTPDGDIYRVPGNKHGDFLYLMKIPIEWYREDQEAKQKDVSQTEDALYNPDHLQRDIRDGGMYGGLKIDH